MFIGHLSYLDHFKSFVITPKLYIFIWLKSIIIAKYDCIYNIFIVFYMLIIPDNYYKAYIANLSISGELRIKK